MDQNSLRPPNLASLVEAQGRSTDAGVVIGDDEIPFRDLFERASRLASALQGAGVAAGDLVATMVPNCREALEVLIAASAMGATFVPLNFRYREHELRQVLGDCLPKVVLVDDDPELDPNRTELLRAVIGEWSSDGSTGPGSPARRSFGIQRVVRVAPDGAPPVGTYAGLIDGHGPCPPPPEHSLRTGPLAIMYTSGTSAAPKGALVPEAAFTIRQADIAARLGLRPGDRVFSPLPLFHVAGFIAFLSSVSVGATYVTNRYFDAAIACASIERHRCRAAWTGFDTILRTIIEASEAGAGSLRSLEVDAVIGQPSSVQLLESRLEHCRLLMIYGSTELGSAACLPAPTDDLNIRTETAGFELEGTTIAILDEGGALLGPGQAGEICGRGEAVALGYHGPGGTVDRARFDADGWFHSGDLGLRRPDGRVQYLARLTDLIKVGGENVSAAEIEGFLIRHPKVYEVQVVGVPDRVYGEVPVAFVQWAPGEVGTVCELRRYCEGQLSRFRIPKEFVVMETGEWPRSATKIQKNVLRANYQARQSPQLERQE